ncbi:MAG TPA: PAS domain-containing protein [Candidatus Sulfotelmatobacter sp.]|nr:PAS domain-containing protein [Candidatus Sulfotelmatobacter sp.]
MTVTTFDEAHAGVRRHRVPDGPGNRHATAPGQFRRRVIRYAILAAAAATAALLWAGIFLHLERVRVGVIAKSEAAASNLARASEEHMLRTLTAIDQALLSMRVLYAEHPGPFDFLAAMPEAQEILKFSVGAYLAKADGRVIWSSTGTGYGNYIGDREHFMFHAHSREDVPYISKPVIGRVSGKPSILVTRRISLPDGAFGGVVGVALDPAYLDSFYQSIDLGPHGTITVFGLDGVVRARSGHGPTEIGQELANAPVMSAERNAPEGLIHINSVFDGLPKFIAYRRIADFPLIVTVAIDEGDALAAFRQESRAVVLAGLGITLLIAGFTTLLIRQLARTDAMTSALAASEERYQLLVDGNREGIYDRDFARGTIWLSDRVHQSLGLADGVLNGNRSRFLKLVHPDDLLTYDDEICRLLAAGESHVTTLFRMRHVDGSWRWMETRGRIVYAADGTPLRAVGSFGDITDHKTAEAALIESHRHLVDAERLGQVGSLVYDASSDRVYWSDSLFELRHAPKREFFTRDEAMRFVHPDDVELYETARASAIAERRDFEVDTRAIRSDGTMAWEHTIGHPRFDDDGNFTGLLLVIRDNTNIREAEQALRQSEERYALAVDGMREGLFDRDFKSGTIWFSSRVHELLGVPDRSLNCAREAFASLIHPDDRGPYEAAVLRCQAEHRPHNGATVRIRRADGAWRWIVIRGSALYDDAGMLSRAVGSIGDITEQKLAEQALQESEARFRSLIEHSSDIYYILNPTGHILYRSPTATTTFGYTDADTRGRSILERVHDDDVGAVAAALRPDGAATPTHGTARVRHRDGSWRHVSWTCSHATDVPGIGGIVLNVRDVTASVTMEAQLRQAQKMEAVGRLAGGIAHDFNNILGAILGFSSLLLEDLPVASAERKFAERIAKASDRGKQLVQQILAFSRQSNVEREPTDLRRVVTDVRELLTSSMPPSTRLDISTRNDPLVAEANAGEITQILLNLCINANDALAGRPGRISIELSDVRPGDPDHAAFHGDRADRGADGAARVTWGRLDPDLPYARICVADSGPGIDPELLTRVFEPFFTTKAPGRGTGLGLSVVHGTVLSYDGAGLAVSRPGGGTTFTIYLPLIDAEPRRASSPQRLPNGSGDVLLVDDDRSLADALTIALQRRGYEVVTANDPSEAISIFAQRPHRWAVVVSDQTMPGMTGLTLHSRLKTIRPDLRFILCTGFSDGSVERAAHGANIDAVFIKPVPLEQLIACVQETVAAASARPPGGSEFPRQAEQQTA